MLLTFLVFFFASSARISIFSLRALAAACKRSQVIERS
jgi:hypothetical protein